jgi:hypothetical protein
MKLSFTTTLGSPNTCLGLTPLRVQAVTCVQRQVVGMRTIQNSKVFQREQGRRAAANVEEAAKWARKVLQHVRKNEVWWLSKIFEMRAS